MTAEQAGAILAALRDTEDPSVTITEAARRHGVAPSTLRNWHERKLQSKGGYTFLHRLTKDIVPRNYHPELPPPVLAQLIQELRTASDPQERTNIKILLACAKPGTTADTVAAALRSSRRHVMTVLINFELYGPAAAVRTAHVRQGNPAASPQLRAGIIKMGAENPAWSQGTIAEKCGVGRVLVNKVLRAHLAGQNQSARTTP